MKSLIILIGILIGVCDPYEEISPPAPTSNTTSTTSSTLVNSSMDNRNLNNMDFSLDGINHNLLACIRSWEGPYDSNTGNGYYGGYQFDLPTWASVGGEGLPSDASPKEQDKRAWMLYESRGLQPWPTPSVRCSHLE